MSRHLSTVPREKLPMHCLKELQLKGKDCVCEMLINIRRIRRCTTLRLHDRNTISEVTKEEKVGAWEMLGDRGVVNSDVCSTQECRRCDCHEPKTTATKLWSSEFRGRKLNTINPTKHSFLGSVCWCVPIIAVFWGRARRLWEFEVGPSYRARWSQK